MIKTHQTDPLLEAIERLTRARTARYEQEDENGDTRVTLATAPSLLAELRDGIAGGIGAHAGATMRTKIPIDAGAFDLNREITQEVLRWCSARSALPHYRDPNRTVEAHLHAWYVAVAAQRRRGDVTIEQEWDYIRTLDYWARRIRDMFAPPTKREIMAPCPVCGERWALDAEGENRIAALIVTDYRPATGELDAVSAVCRNHACATEWHGIEAITELGEEITTPDPSVSNLSSTTDPS